MITFKQFITEDRDLGKTLTDHDFHHQAFMGMDAYDIRDNHKHKPHSEKQLVSLSEEMELFEAKITGERGDAKFDSEKYSRIRKSKQDKLENVYGTSDKPMSNKEISANAVSSAKWFDSLHPKEQKAELSAASKRRKAANLGSHLSGNQKNETANDVPTNGKKNYTVGISGSPAQFSHITSGGAHKIVNTCVNATDSCGGVGKERGTGGSCLAQKAQGQQHTNRASRDHYSQGERHSPESNRDHVITMMHEIRSMNKKANEGSVE